MGVAKRSRKAKGKKTVFYQAEIYVNGLRLDSKCFETKAEAYLWHEERKKELEKGVKSNHILDLTFSDCVKKYQLEALPQLRKSSQQSMSVRFKYFFDSPISSIAMTKFGVAHIDEWMKWLHKHPTASNPNRKSFQHELRALSIVLNWYRNEIDYKFVVPILKKHRKACSLPGATQRRPDYYVRKEDLPRWLGDLKKHEYPVYYDLALFLILTGLRLGEACGLHWDAVDLEGCFISVIRTLAWDLNSKEPYLQQVAKTEQSIRVVSIPQELVELLTRRRANHSAKTSLVFYNRDGNFLRQTKIYDVFTRSFKRSGLDWTGARITRNTWATLGLIANQGNISAIQANMGHKNRKTTERYARPVQHMFDGVVDKTASYINLPRCHHVTDQAQKGAE
ncbi:MAG: tyrosine-type recombinase/integrase [Oligoflexales bacterium]